MMTSTNVIALKRPPPAPTVRDYAVAQAHVKGLCVRETKRSSGTTRTYMYRYAWLGQNVRLGMGPVEDTTERAAIAEAQRYAAWLADGKDPKVERDAQRDVKENGAFTFQRAAEEWMVRKLPGLKNDKHQTQIKSRLSALYPKLGRLPMAAISPSDVAKAIEPMWIETNPTAIKTLRYVKDVFNAAIAHGRRTDANPADMAVLQHHLTKVRKGRQRHFASLPWEQLPEFWRELAGERGDGADALRLTLLTAQRTAQVIESTLDQFHPDKGLWVFEFEDVEMMKTDETVALHRVAMGPLACQLVRARKDLLTELTPKQSKLFGIANMTMLSVLKRMGYWEPGLSEKGGRITVHGFRSTFRTWFEDNWMKIGIWDNAPPGFQPHLLAEAQLSHTGGKSKIDAAYQRSDLLTLRLKVMAKFEEFVTGKVRQ
jgi:integrase